MIIVIIGGMTTPELIAKYGPAEAQRIIWRTLRNAGKR